MQCLRIVSHNVDSGERTRRVRIPIFAVKTAARFLPPSVFALVDERITKEIARDILEAAPRAADEIARQQRDDEAGVPGLIAEVEERRGGPHDAFAQPQGAAEWTERTLVYIE